MDVAIIRRADEQANATRKMAIASHRLNLLAASFFPLATLGAIFSTTLTDGWSWSRSTLGFTLFLIAGVALGGLLAMFISTPGQIRFKK